MDTKLWIILMTVSTMISLSSQGLMDFSGLMGGGLGKEKDKDKASTPAPQQQEYNSNQYNNNNNNQYNQQYNQQGQQQKPNKGQKQSFSPFSKDQLKQDLSLDKFDKLDGKLKPDKMDKKPDQQNNYTSGYSNNNNYNYSNLATPVENPVYSTYIPQVPRPIFDDGAYSQPPMPYGVPHYNSGPQYGSQPAPQYGSAPPPQYGGRHQVGSPQYGQPSGQSYGNRNNLTGYNVYRQMYGYNNPSHSNYGRPSQRPNYQSAPIYGNGQSSNAYNEAPGQYGGPVHGEVYGGGYDSNNYHEEPSYHGHNQSPIDYSKYINPLPYSDLSEYISPAQYNQYTSQLYSAYNVPTPSLTTYSNQNYTTKNNYNSHYRLSVGVAIIDGRFGYSQRSNIKGTLFITEIYPQVCVVSGVIQGLPPNYRYGIHIYDYGDLTQGCQSIGGHYNPLHKSHGNIGARQSHLGDLGNIQSDPAGISFVNKIARGQFSTQGNFPVAGRSIGICEKQDDLGLGGNVLSLKDGNCGYIEACGIIGISNDGAVHSGYY